MQSTSTCSLFNPILEARNCSPSILSQSAAVPLWISLRVFLHISARGGHGDGCHRCSRCHTYETRMRLRKGTPVYITRQPSLIYRRFATLSQHPVLLHHVFDYVFLLITTTPSSYSSAVGRWGSLRTRVSSFTPTAVTALSKRSAPLWCIFSICQLSEQTDSSFFSSE